MNKSKNRGVGELAKNQPGERQYTCQHRESNIQMDRNRGGWKNERKEKGEREQEQRDSNH